MTQLRIYLLGSAYVEQQQRRIEFDTRKALALLAYLSVTARAYQRDTLSTIFWPENNQEHARAALRRTLSVLKNGLPANIIQADRGQIWLVKDAPLWCDAIEFDRWIDQVNAHLHPSIETCPECHEILEKAVHMYRGDFLSGFTLRDSPAFDDWQFYQTDHYRQEYSWTLEKLSRVYCNRAAFDKSIDYAKKWLALDKLREEAHQQLMRCYAWSGQRSQALQQYRQCVRILEEELGVSPLEETTDLYHAILDNRLDVIPTPAVLVIDQMPPGLNSTPAPVLTPQAVTLNLDVPLPLVGRSRETETMLQIFQSKAPQGHLLILQGEPGVGKTRLAADFLAFAERQGARILSGSCYPGENDLAYAPFTAALRTYHQNKAIGEIIQNIPLAYLREAARIVPELETLLNGKTFPTLDEFPNTPSILFEGLRQVIISLLQGISSGILFLDDIHWADSASLQFFAYLVHRLKGVPFLILVTCRNESLPEPLNKIIYDSQAQGNGTLLDLHRLSLSEIRDLLYHFFQAPPGKLESLSRRIFSETEGLPYFVVEYLRSLLAVQPIEILIDQSTSQEWSIPGGVQNMLRSRLSGIDDTSWQVLTSAAVIGRSFTFDVLQETSGRSEIETLTSLESLLARKLIEEICPDDSLSAGSFDFTHDKMRQFVYEQAPVTRQRLLHRRAAEALIKGQRLKPGSGASASQIARHLQLSGANVLAAEYYKNAGDDARLVFGHQEAIHHYQAAIALGYPEPAALHEAIGDLFIWRAEYGLAIAGYHSAASLAGQADQARLEHKLAVAHHRRGDYELADGYFKAALELAENSSTDEELAAFFADWSQTAYKRGDRIQAQAYAEKSLVLAGEFPSSRSLSKAHNILGILARANGYPDQARWHLENSLQIARNNHDLVDQVAANNNLARIFQDQKQIDTALKLARDALTICQQINDRHHEAALFDLLAELYHANGQDDEAMDYLKQAVQRFAEIRSGVDEPSPEIWMLSEW